MWKKGIFVHLKDVRLQEVVVFYGLANVSGVGFVNNWLSKVLKTLLFVFRVFSIGYIFVKESNDFF